MRLAEAGAKGVDTLAARLIVDEARIAADRAGDETALLADLHLADTRPDLDAFAYPAAVALAEAAVHSARWANAQTAWRSAQLHVRGATDDPSLALGRALVGEAMASIKRHDDAGARALLQKANQLLTPLAPETADADHISAAETQYAQIKALIAAVHARQTSEGPWSMPTNDDIDRPSLPGMPPLCPGELEPDPMLTFPDKAESDELVGAGVFRFETDAKGKIGRFLLVSVIGGDPFRKALTDPQIHWRFIPHPKVAGCRMQSSDRLLVVKFLLQ